MQAHGRHSLPELLAPAGSKEALHAALQAGADAVYFGLDSGFNARARAENFSLANLRETCARIHRAGAKAYLALNTLVFEVELPAVERLIVAAAEAGVDALIVQDPAVALLARERAPSLEVHASTQMTIASAEAARFASALGATRVVLPRELSLTEIRHFTRNSPIAAEVFVHGALCVAWSGQCLTSEVWGQRSANRGQCAQSCRMPYDVVLDGRVQEAADIKYLLSPLDLAGLPLLNELLELPLAGLKIEGRQKGAAYVATAVQAWREGLDGGGTPSTARLSESMNSMALAYSRGFSPGFLAGSNHQRLVEGRFPKHRGLFVGRVLEVDVEGNRVLVGRDLEGRPWTGALLAGDRAAGPQGQSALNINGSAWREQDGFAVVNAGTGVVFDDGHPEDPREAGGMVRAVRTVGRNLDMRFGTPGPDLTRVRAGQRVFANMSPEVMSLTQSAGHAPAPLQRNWLDLVVSGQDNAPLQVKATTATGQCHLTSPMPLAQSRGKGLDDALLREKLGSFGGTIFHLRNLELSELGTGLHLPVTALKELRRRLVEHLQPLAERGPKHETAAEPALPRLAAQARTAVTTHAEQQPPLLIPLVRTLEQLDAVLDTELPEVELDFMDFTGLGRAVERARAASKRLTIATVRVQKPMEEAYDRRIEALQPDGVLLRHFGALTHFREHPVRRALHGDFSLNVTNSITAAHLMQLGLETITASHDLDEAQLLALLEATDAARVTVVLRHRISTFHTEHCVYAHLLSNGRDFHSCGRPCDEHALALKDHLGREHPVLVDVGCRNTVFNAEATTNAPLVPRLLERGVRRFRCEFVRESGAELSRTLQSFQGLLAGTIRPEECVNQLGLGVQQGVSAKTMEVMV